MANHDILVCSQYLQIYLFQGKNQGTVLNRSNWKKRVQLPKKSERKNEREWRL